MAHIGSIVKEKPVDYGTPPWSLYDEHGNVSKWAILGTEDVVFVIEVATGATSAEGAPLIKIIHAPSGSVGWIEDVLVDF